ncbi:hypothetical protein D9619_010086 [Psilocybe cf. subviscida]|uniref:F-box domain-containing protein n=1 Tax=Psilocybe cf. subviscida TaxID=2480587 RepID=A0A8H5BL23_9AGAR|nr:hypothetical protein D9619_010086 [Psilocybe cf. subviscida]
MSCKELQRKIDEEVSAYQKRIRELNTHRNTYADISMLPQELLVDIFLLVQSNSPLKNWHQITHVCQRWRDTAVSTPILWTKPPTRHHNYTILMLERSKTANLNIFLESQISTATLSSILSHIGRVHTLKMSLTTRALIDVCGRLIASGHMLSHLEGLDIKHSSQWHSTTVDWTFLSILIRQSSSLRSIRLSLVTFDWQMLAPSNLASLHLIQIGLVEKISGKTLLDTLGKMPCLQHLALDLDDLLLPQNPPYTGEVDKIALLHLRSLDIIDYKRPHIPYLLSHLLLPKLNSFKIATFRVRDGQGYSSDSLAAITTTIANGDFRVSGALLVERNHLRISAFGEVFVDIRLPRATNGEYEIRCTQQLLRQIAPSFHGLVQVTLVIPLNSDELFQIFGNMHRLKAVTVYQYGAQISALTDALAHCSDHANCPQGARAFSSLDTIGCNAVYWDEVDSGVVTNFCNVLLQRFNHAAAIKTVYCADNLQRLNLSRQASKLLREGGICVKNGEVPREYGFSDEMREGMHLQSQNSVLKAK